MNNYQCNACGGLESGPILLRREDMEYNIGLKLNYFQCSSQACRHVQAFPMPESDIISSFYKSYTTHHGYDHKGIARLIFNFFQKKVKNQILTIGSTLKLSFDVRILDYGSGNGVFMGHLKDTGYGNITGFDFDTSAVSYAVSSGYNCYSNFDDIKNSGKFDIVFMNHVIEHLPNPLNVINEVIQIINPGGFIVIRTPNTDSFMSDFFKQYWRGWETPRHLNLFNHDSLKCFINSSPNCAILKESTSNDMALQMAIESFANRMPGINKFIKWFLSLVVYFKSLITNFFKPNSGEELFFIIKRNHS